MKGEWTKGHAPDDWIIDGPRSITWTGIFEGKKVIALVVGQDQISYGDCREELERHSSLIAAAPALAEALDWYALQVENCRKATSEGEEARKALDRDGGQRARAALSLARGEG